MVNFPLYSSHQFIFLLPAPSIWPVFSQKRAKFTLFYGQNSPRAALHIRLFNPKIHIMLLTKHITYFRVRPWLGDAIRHAYTFKEK
ncbi:hypothetical protein THS27_17490 [Thalassospira sp. MCCC 1A01428]|nr:hypothetical protein THS27_17490 [Thalassospira sp. MCCC 1A01428]